MKKRLFISSILMTLVLLVAITTATFAWYSASAGSTVKVTNTDQKIITATDDSYNVGAEISIDLHFVEFVAATGEFDEDGVYYTMSGTTPSLVASPDEDDFATYFVKQNISSFADIDVTDVNGAAQAISANGLVDVNPDKPNHVGYVFVSLSEDSSYTLAELIALLPTSVDAGYTITIETPEATTPVNHARIHASAPTQTTNGYANAGTLTANLSFTRTSGSWSVTAGTCTSVAALGDGYLLTFFYSCENGSSDTAVAETSAAHAHDDIKVSVAAK